MTSLLRVSAAQAEATSKETGIKTGEIWGTGELRGWFEEGARRIAKDEGEREVGGVVHGDYKIDNLVSTDVVVLGNGLRGCLILQVDVRGMVGGMSIRKTMTCEARIEQVSDSCPRQCGR